MEIFDISQTIRPGIAVWPGDEAYRRSQTLQLRLGHSCNLSAITMSLHTGTHLDAPLHFDDSGCDIAGISLTHTIGPARVVEFSADRCITAAVLMEKKLQGLERILLKTRVQEGSPAHFDPDFTYLEEDGADYLGRCGLVLVGTDAPSIDAFGSKTLAAHHVLLAHGIAILEGLRLDHVPAGDYELICLPLKLEGADGSPVRAILRR